MAFMNTRELGRTIAHPKEAAVRHARNRLIRDRDRVNKEYKVDFRHCPELKDIKDHEFPEVLEITPDAQRRYGRKMGISNEEAYQHGTDNLLTVVDAATDLPIKTLIAWAFSADNWQRPDEEVDGLLKLMLKNFPKLRDKIMEKDGVFSLIGRREIRQDKAAQFEAYVPFHQALLSLERETAENNGKNVAIAFDFSGEDQEMRELDRAHELGFQQRVSEGVVLSPGERTKIETPEQVSELRDTGGKIASAHLGIRTGENVTAENGMILAHISDVGWINGTPTFWALSEKYFPLFTLKDMAVGIRKYVVIEKRGGK